MSIVEERMHSESKGQKYQLENKNLSNPLIIALVDWSRKAPERVQCNIYTLNMMNILASRNWAYISILARQAQTVNIYLFHCHLFLKKMHRGNFDFFHSIDGLPNQKHRTLNFSLSRLRRDYFTDSRTKWKLRLGQRLHFLQSLCCYLTSAHTVANGWIKHTENSTESLDSTDWERVNKRQKKQGKRRKKTPKKQPR